MYVIPFVIPRKPVHNLVVIIVKPLLFLKVHYNDRRQRKTHCVCQNIWKHHVISAERQNDKNCVKTLVLMEEFSFIGLELTQLVE